MRFNLRKTYWYALRSHQVLTVVYQPSANRMSQYFERYVSSKTLFRWNTKMHQTWRNQDFVLDSRLFRVNAKWQRRVHDVMSWVLLGNYDYVVWSIAANVHFEGEFRRWVWSFLGILQHHWYWNGVKQNSKAVSSQKLYQPTLTYGKGQLFENVPHQTDWHWKCLHLDTFRQKLVRQVI